MSNRDLFTELNSALVEAKNHSEGKLTLKTHQISNVGELNISPDEIVITAGALEALNLSLQAVTESLRYLRDVGF